MEVPKVLGDVFEALAGAIFIDSDRSLDAVWKVFYRLMQHEIGTFILQRNYYRKPVSSLTILT